MPIPRLDREGFLPVGVHVCNLEEIGSRFGKFNQTDRRVALFERLERLVAEVRATGLVQAVIVDGSFVTIKPAPQDVDIILALGRLSWDTQEITPFASNAISA